jgi:hypothetical protein
MGILQMGACRIEFRQGELKKVIRDGNKSGSENTHATTGAAARL